MPALRLYTDASVPVAIAAGLRRRGVDAWSARDAGNLGWSDEQQLEYAGRERAVVFTSDPDFLALAAEWSQKGKEHYGIIFAHQQKYGIGECIRRLMDYTLLLDPENMKNRVEFL